MKKEILELIKIIRYLTLSLNDINSNDIVIIKNRLEDLENECKRRVKE